MRKLLAATIAALLFTSGCTAVEAEESSPGAAEHPACGNERVAVGADGEFIAELVDRTADEADLTSVIYRVTRDGELIAAGAVGESVTGVAATQDMHFRNGNVAFAYMSTLLLLMDEDGTLSIDDPVSKWVPALELPNADTVTLRMLVQSTSGYPDYVRDEQFRDSFLAEPFQQFSPQQLIEFAFNTPPLYEPGEAWNYAHTNYVILGEVLAAAGEKPLADLITERVIAPMGLIGTQPVLDPQMPEPVLHSFSTERGVFEETTYWNPSWQTATGSVLATNICDLVDSAHAVGTGELLSESSYEAMIAADTAALAPPPATCTVCREFDDDMYYGMGVIVRSNWLHQTPLFGGAGAVHAYLPSEDIAVAMVAVTGRGSTPNTNYAMQIWTDIAAELTPDNVPES